MGTDWLTIIGDMSLEVPLWTNTSLVRKLPVCHTVSTVVLDMVCNSCTFMVRMAGAVRSLVDALTARCAQVELAVMTCAHKVLRGIAARMVPLLPTLLCEQCCICYSSRCILATGGRGLS